MNKITYGIAIASLAGAVQAAELGAVDEPIKLAINEWTGQHVTTHIAGEMLKAAGYKVEYTTAGYMNMYQAMADGELHAALEIWSSNVSEDYAKKVEAGTVTEIGDLGLDAKEGIAYPAHVEELCPGLPAWEALKECAGQFATAETLAHGPSGGLPRRLGYAGGRPDDGFRSAVQGRACGVRRCADHRAARLHREEVAAADHLLAAALGDVGL